jgi:DNA-directed RNA polymerase beta' subunit
MDVAHVIERRLAPLPPGIRPALASTAIVHAASHGDVRTPETINIRTGALLPRGLFCPNIFGGSPERAVRFGHIDLAVPVLHPWFDALAADALGWSAQELTRVRLYEAQVNVATGALATDEEAFEDPSSAFEMGGRAILTRLERVGAPWVAAMISSLPVLPPDLRPIAWTDGSWSAHDLNDLYRRVLNRNIRLKRLVELCAPEIIVRNEQRMVQQAVDALFDNANTPSPVMAIASSGPPPANAEARGRDGTPEDAPDNADSKPRRSLTDLAKEHARTRDELAPWLAALYFVHSR